METCFGPLLFMKNCSCCFAKQLHLVKASAQMVGNCFEHTPDSCLAPIEDLPIKLYLYNMYDPNAGTCSGHVSATPWMAEFPLGPIACFLLSLLKSLADGSASHLQHKDTQSKNQDA